MAFTYLIMTPGFDLKSYIVLPGGRQINYVKFGDSDSAHEDSQGIRQAYITHNPDIGVFALMNSSCYHFPLLGTRLKTFMAGPPLNVDRIEGTEWFRLDHERALRLCVAINNKWDDKTLVAGDEEKIQAAILKSLQ